jgi:hypothetical protein
MKYTIQIDVFGTRRIIDASLKEIHNWRCNHEMPSFFDDFARWVVASRLFLGHGKVRMSSVPLLNNSQSALTTLSLPKLR